MSNPLGVMEFTPTEFCALACSRNYDMRIPWVITGPHKACYASMVGSDDGKVVGFLRWDEKRHSWHQVTNMFEELCDLFGFDR